MHSHHEDILLFLIFVVVSLLLLKILRLIKNDIMMLLCFVLHNITFSNS